MPSVFKIPDTLEKKYHGSGYAMASVTCGQVVNLIYLRDVSEAEQGNKMPYS